MRELSLAELRVIESLLARPDAKQSKEMRDMGMPRRTFQSIRQRVILRRWIEGRLTPDCRPLGRRWVEVALVQPHLEARQRVVEAWNSSEGVVCLWAMSDTLLAVGFTSGEKGSFLVEAANPDNLHWSHSVTVDLEASAIPVFFDYEGAWAKLAGHPPSGGYPRSYPPRPSVNPDETPDRVRHDLEWLFEHSPQSDMGQGEQNVLLRAKYRRRLAQSLNHGWVTQRAFLEPATMCTQVAMPADRMVFVLGALAVGSTSRELLSELRVKSRLAPFLFLADDRAVLIGSLLASPSANPDPTSSPFAVLKRHCTGIHAVRERMESFTPIVDYRFDRLLLDSRKT